MKIIIFGLLLLSVMIVVIPLPAYACEWLEHPEKCVLEVVEAPIDEAISDFDKDIVKPIEDDVKQIPEDISTAIDDFDKDIVDPIENDVSILKADVESLPGIIGDVEKDVEKIVTTAENIEYEVVNEIPVIITDIKTDIGIIKTDIAIAKEDVRKVAEFLEKIEKDGVDIIEFIAKDFVKDLKYIIYAVIAIVVGYIIIRIIQFALWLHAYLKADNLDSNSKLLTAQNEQIISLLTKIVDQKNTFEK